jgi:hypothetical protein
MAVLVTAIHVFRAAEKDVDGRDEPGYDEQEGRITTSAIQGAIYDCIPQR